EQLLMIEKNAAELKMYVHVDYKNFEIIVIENGKLLLYNTFEFNTKEDFIYYILFTAEQLKINPETLHLIFIGNINKEDAFYNMAYKYIRHIDFGNFVENYTYPEKTLANHLNFTLIKSF